MSQNHYAILGVAPTASPAAVRTAYLALMREYHPDRNPSAAAVQRAQAIGAAYKVLGDFDRRQEYDFDRRRARDAAAALAARPKPRGSAVIVIASALGLAVAGAMALLPGSDASLPPDRLPDAAIAKPTPRQQAALVAARTPKHPKAPPATPIVEQFAITETTREVHRLPPSELGAGKRPATRPVESRKPVRGPVAKLAAAEPVRPKVKPKPDASAARPAPVIVVAAANAPPKHAPGKPAGNDLASLDQFVMSFYGQSWRYGDARRRAALEQSRNGFVVRRGGCSTDACKRAAYLKLQRDVSAIIESGEPLITALGRRRRRSTRPTGNYSRRASR